MLHLTCAPRHRQTVRSAGWCALGSGGKIMPEIGSVVRVRERDIGRSEAEKVTERRPSLGDVEDKQTILWHGFPHFSETAIERSHASLAIGEITSESMRADDFNAPPTHLACNARRHHLANTNELHDRFGIALPPALWTPDRVNDLCVRECLRELAPKMCGSPVDTCAKTGHEHLPINPFAPCRGPPLGNLPVIRKEFTHMMTSAEAKEFQCKLDTHGPGAAETRSDNLERHFRFPNCFACPESAKDGHYAFLVRRAMMNPVGIQHRTGAIADA